jgi:subtilisin family serine protease
MDMDHPDLQPNLLDRNGDDWDFSSSGFIPHDGLGHGTKVCGIAVAVQDNEIGVSGIAPGCRIMPLKISGLPGQNQDRADAINYATGRRPEFSGLVINGSWGMSAGDFTAVEAACQNAWDNDVVLCFASGNDNVAQIEFPAAYATTIAVGASSPCDERKSPTSCDGETWWGSHYGDELDVVAPGVKIYTTKLGGGSDGFFAGTSASSPLAAGICALIWSANPTLANAEVRQILRDSAEDQVGPPEEDGPGWDPYMGYGRVNARLALELAASSGIDELPEPGARAEVLPIWPNPASGSAHLRFRLSESSPVTLTVHDARGRLIRRYDVGFRRPGAHALAFDARDRRGRPLPAGVYLVRMVAGSAAETGRLVLVD